MKNDTKAFEEGVKVMVEYKGGQFEQLERMMASAPTRRVYAFDRRAKSRRLLLAPLLKRKTKTIVGPSQRQQRS